MFWCPLGFLQVWIVVTLPMEARWDWGRDPRIPAGIASFQSLTLHYFEGSQNVNDPLWRQDFLKYLHLPEVLRDRIGTLKISERRLKTAWIWLEKGLVGVSPPPLEASGLCPKSCFLSVPRKLQFGSSDIGLINYVGITKECKSWNQEILSW